MGLDTWITPRLDAVERALAACLPGDELVPTRLHEAMRHAVLGGGKRVRALLCLATAEALQAKHAAALKAACAIELLHAYSLVHDDMPCMDNDILRRGKPTVHVAFGEATALLVGDGLQALAFEVLCSLATEDLPPLQVIAALDSLAKAAGPAGMVGGQAVDLALAGSAQHVDPACDLPTLEAMHRRKTGALLAASVELGMCCASDAGARTVAAPHLRRFAQAIGLAFQIVDDVLDVESDSATLGKTAGKDSAMAKPTYVSLLGLAEARRRAQALHHEAHAALHALASLPGAFPAHGMAMGDGPGRPAHQRADIGAQSPVRHPQTEGKLARLGELADLIIMRRS